MDSPKESAGGTVNAVLVLFDCVAFLVISWTAFAVVHDSSEVMKWREAGLVSALVAVKIGAFCAALAVVATAAPLAWWARGVVTGAALVAGMYYEHRFGIMRQARMLAAWLAAHTPRRHR